VDATDINQVLDTLQRTVHTKGLKVLLMQSICRLHEKGKDEGLGSLVSVDAEKCRGEKCMICVREFSCPALEWDEETGKARVVEFVCIRCGACIDVCPHEAIRQEE